MLGPWEKSADIFRPPTTKKEKTTDISRVAASLIEIAGEDFTIKDADRSASRTNLYRKFEWGVTMAGDAKKS